MFFSKKNIKNKPSDFISNEKNIIFLRHYNDKNVSIDSSLQTLL